MAGPDLLLPEGSRLIHIGPHKTGSTAIQVAMDDARAELARHGVHYAGEGRRPRLAGWSIGLPGKKAGVPRPGEEHWERLAHEVQAATASRVCISNEDFCRAGPKQRERIVADLGGDQAHVVAVVRRLDTYLPSQWQERVKAGVTLSWEEWLRIVLKRGVEEFHFERANVWRAHDVSGMVGRWTDIVGPDRFTLVVADDRDHDLLPRTFERLLGLPSGLLQPPAPDRANRSLSWAEVEAVRVVHQAFTDQGVSRRGRDPWVDGGITRTLRHAGDSGHGPRRPPYPPWAAEVVERMSTRRAAYVRSLVESGTRVVGDPDSLLASSDLPVGEPTPPGLDAETFALIAEALVRATVEHSPGLVTPETEDDAADEA